MEHKDLPLNGDAICSCNAICAKLYNFIRFEVAKAVTEATWHSTCCILPQAAYTPLLPTLLKKKLEKNSFTDISAM